MTAATEPKAPITCPHCTAVLNRKQRHCDSPTCTWLKCASCGSRVGPRGHDHSGTNGHCRAGNIP